MQQRGADSSGPQAHILKILYIVQLIPAYETPNLDWNAEFPDAESRFSQLMYQGQTLVVHKLTESRFGIPKFGIPIEIWSLMSPGIGCNSICKYTRALTLQNCVPAPNPRP
jgi:hypothetical protein